MPTSSLIPWNLAAVVASIAAMVTGIRADLPAFSWIAAATFATALVATAIDLNRPLWSDPEAIGNRDAQVVAALRNARLLVIGYFWGAFSLLAFYRGTGLKWQHGLQYGAGMALFAWLALLYAHFLARPDSRLRSPRSLLQATWLTIFHGAAATAGLAFLLLSGKILSAKDDWAANQIFMTGGIAIAALSFISAHTQFRLSKARPGDAPIAAAKS